MCDLEFPNDRDINLLILDPSIVDMMHQFQALPFVQLLGALA